jgi:hypothetical protein
MNYFLSSGFTPSFFFSQREKKKSGAMEEVSTIKKNPA